MIETKRAGLLGAKFHTKLQKLLVLPLPPPQSFAHRSIMHSARGPLLAVALLAILGVAWSIDAPLLMWSGSKYADPCRAPLSFVPLSCIAFQLVLLRIGCFSCYLVIDGSRPSC